MRIKIIGDNNCARATRHLLRKAGFAVTEFLPADVVTQAPHSGYAITIELAPAPHTPDPASKPDHSTHGPSASAIEEASALGKASGGASSPTPNYGGDSPSAGAPHAAPLQARGHQQSRACIHFDSVDSELEAAILRHVTQIAVAPVIVDRPGGVVHSERELRIVAPNSGDAKADEAAAVAVEFGVLRGLLDLASPTPPAARGKLFGNSEKTGPPAGSAAKPQGQGGRKWWRKIVSRAVQKIRGTQAEACATGGAAQAGRGCVAGISLCNLNRLREGRRASVWSRAFRCGCASDLLMQEGAEICPPRYVAQIRRRDAGAIGTRACAVFSRGTRAAAPLVWKIALAVLALFAVAGNSHAAPRRALNSARTAPATVALSANTRAADRAALLPTAALPPQGQFSTGQAPVKITDGTNTLVVDPCKAQTKLYASISQTANSQLVAGSASKKIYICSIHVVVAVATSVALVEGTGSVCATGTAGVSGFGGATAATGWNFAVNGGIVLGNGDAAVGAEATSADNLCLFNSGSGQVSGGISYVVQ